MTVCLAGLILQNFDPPWFWALLIIVSLAILLATYRDIRRRSGRNLTWILLTLRMLAVLALLVALVKPAWRHVIHETERPHLAVIVDNSQSMSVPQPSGDDWSTRYQRTLQWLRESPDGRTLRDRFDLHFFDVAGRRLDADDLPAEPNAEETNLVRAMRSVAQDLRGRHAAGVLLLTDGRDTTGRRSYLALQEYELAAYTLGFRWTPAREGGPSDLAVVSVDAPARTLVHNTVQVKALLRKDGGDALDAPVHVERAGTVLATERVRFDEGAAEKLVNISFTPAEPGDFVLTVRLPARADERTRTNNAAMFKLRVDAEPIRVLYIEGVLRTEYKFLRRRLADDPDVDLISFVRTASPDQVSVSGVLAGSELASPERLEKIDVVLLGDFESRMVDDRAYEALRDWVEAGGGLFVLGGYRNLSGQGLTRTPLGEALPVEPLSGGIEQIDRPFSFSLTADGQRHPALTVTGDLARDARLWESLPELAGVVAVRGARPGASVLARHPEINPFSDDGEGYVVLAVQSFGKGAVAVLTADTTWRWSRLPRLAGRPDTLYVRFWSQLVRWLAHRDAASERTALTVSTDVASYRRGRRVLITVRRNPAVMIPGAEGSETSLDVTVINPDQRKTPLSPEADATDPNLWTASYFPDRGGRFQVWARLARAEGDRSADVANQRTEFIVEGSRIELEDPAPNNALLREIARLTGGVFAELDQPEDTAALVDQLPAGARVTAKARTSHVWNSPALFLLFLALVTVEWIVRRRNQLV